MARFLFLLAGCAGAPGDTEDAEAESELSTSCVYKCSLLPNQNRGWEAVQYVRASSKRVTWNTKRSFTKSGGARVAPRDTDYTPRGSVAYARHEEQWQEGNQFGSYDWRLEPEMLAGGKTMRGGDLGGFAIFGARIDWSGTTRPRYRADPP